MIGIDYLRNELDVPLITKRSLQVLPKFFNTPNAPIHKYFWVTLPARYNSLLLKESNGII